eukprot:m.69702 g.69702  ORF g.69702 m.69702 type:complete len:714 (-) comp11642_c0_seq1:102-2243(-)
MSYDEEDLPMLQDGASTIVFKREGRKMRLVVVALGVLCLALLISTIVLGTKNNSSSSSSSAVCNDAACVLDAAQLLKKMNPNVDPCDDFYEYACGGWEADNEIPEDSGSISQFSELADANSVKLRDLLEQGINSTEFKSPGYYSACMNTTTRNKESVKALKEMIATLNDVKTSNEEKIAFLALADVSAFFSLGVGVDDKNATRHTMFLSQGGLGLPDPDYYKYKTVDNNTLLATYSDYITSISTYINVTLSAESVIRIEKKLAEIFVPNDKLRDPVASYNKMTVKEINNIYKFVSIGSVLQIMYKDVEHEGHVDELINQTPDFFEKLNDAFSSFDTSDVNSYLQFRLIHRFVSQLDETANDIHLKLQQALYGSSSLPPQWEICVNAVDNALGFELGRFYVEKYFTEAAKNKIDSMIESIRSAFLSRLSDVQWMDAPTRDVAKGKANAVVQKIGYPEFIMNNKELKKYYEHVTVTPLHISNYIGVVQVEVVNNLLDYFLPVDKSKWGMTPPTVNAYYSPSMNEIVFPAGILQTPFYAASMIDSVNFGAAGVVIGHELSHGFDDQGRQYDKDGDLRQWWSNETVSNFKSRAQCFIDQYSSYVINGEHVNGKLTLGENIADNGGVHTAFAAFKEWQKDNGVEQTLPGMSHTPEQLFFIGFAQVWCSKFRPESTHQRILTDPHSPAKFRVLGSVSNTMDFMDAFNCPVPHRDMCRLW